MDEKNTSAKVDEIHSLGCNISIEDFGTGYTSLMGLQHLPIQKVIINKELLQDVPGNKDNETMVSTLILIAKKLNFEVIIKCIETEAQEDFVRHNDCHEGQGFFYKSPMTKEKLEAGLKLLTS